MSDQTVFFTESSKNIGGQELQLLQQMSELEKNGFQTLLFCRKNSEIAQHAKIRGLSYVTLPLKNALDFMSAISIFRYVVKHKPVALICHSGHDSLIAGWVKYLSKLFSLNLKLIRMRTYQPGRPKSFSYRYLFDKTFTPSEYLKKILLQNPKISEDCIDVLYPGIDFSRLDSAGTQELPKPLLEWLIDHPGPIIAHGAILRGEKNHFFMLEVMKQLVIRNPNVRYVIAGHGPLEADIRRRIYELGLESNVYLAGMLSSIGGLLKQSRIAVLPSSYEPLGMFQIEAQYLGVPVIVSDVGGIPETVMHGHTGFVISLDKQTSWVEMLDRLLNDQMLHASISGRTRSYVTHKFSKDKNTQALIEMISKSESN